MEEAAIDAALREADAIRLDLLNALQAVTIPASVRHLADARLRLDALSQHIDAAANEAAA